MREGKWLPVRQLGIRNLSELQLAYTLSGRNCDAKAAGNSSRTMHGGEKGKEATVVDQGQPERASAFLPVSME